VAAVFLAGLLTAVASAAPPARLPVPAAAAYFPGDFFRQEGRVNMARFVLSRWPGPSRLIGLWRSGRLDESERVGLLLGGAAFHDPVLLPVYRAALGDSDERIREAAAYGFRDLVAAPLPRVERGVDRAAAMRFQWELAAVEKQLATRDLVGFWLDRLGQPDDAASGVYRHAAALRALDALLRPEDLPELVRGYCRLGSRAERLSMLPLMQAMTCRQIILMPRGQRAGWGPSIYDFAMTSLEGWLARRCDFSPQAVLRINLAPYGMRRVDPMSPQACPAWLEVLRRGPAFQWPLASRQLYRCGGPPVFLSMLHPGSKRARRRRSRLLKWFGVHPPRAVRRRRGAR